MVVLNELLNTMMEYDITVWSPDWVHGGAEIDHPGCKLLFLVSLPAHNLEEQVCIRNNTKFNHKKTTVCQSYLVHKVTSCDYMCLNLIKT